MPIAMTMSAMSAMEHSLYFDEELLQATEAAAEHRVGECLLDEGSQLALSSISGAQQIMGRSAADKIRKVLGQRNAMKKAVKAVLHADLRAAWHHLAIGISRLAKHHMSDVAKRAFLQAYTDGIQAFNQELEAPQKIDAARVVLLASLSLHVGAEEAFFAAVSSLAVPFRKLHEQVGAESVLFESLMQHVGAESCIRKGLAEVWSDADYILEELYNDPIVQKELRASGNSERRLMEFDALCRMLFAYHLPLVSRIQLKHGSEVPPLPLHWSSDQTDEIEHIWLHDDFCASLFSNGSLRVYNIGDWKCMKELDSSTAVTCAALGHGYLAYGKSDGDWTSRVEIVETNSWQKVGGWRCCDRKIRRLHIIPHVRTQGKEPRDMIIAQCVQSKSCHVGKLEVLEVDLDVANGKNTRSIRPGFNLPILSSEILPCAIEDDSECMAFNDRFMACAGRNGRLHIYEMHECSCAAVLTEQQGIPIWCLSFGYGLLASGGHDGSVQIYAYMDGIWVARVKLQCHSHRVTSVCFGHDLFVSASESGAVKIYNISDIREETMDSKPSCVESQIHPDRLTCMAPERNKLVTAFRGKILGVSEARGHNYITGSGNSF
eukprot:Skav224660  [mRNA]  locus=scaffold3474:52735:54546:+ [translate_table: standard]